MSDIKLAPVELINLLTYDWFLSHPGTLEEDAALVSAVAVALGTDARADDSDALPGLDDEDKRGWWGDFEAERLHNGWPVGSRLWLLSRSKIRDAAADGGATIALIETYISEALQPFVDQRIISAFNVIVERQGNNKIVATVTLIRGSKHSIDLRFQTLWDDLIKR